MREPGVETIGSGRDDGVRVVTLLPCGVEYGFTITKLPDFSKVKLNV